MPAPEIGPGACPENRRVRQQPDEARRLTNFSPRWLRLEWRKLAGGQVHPVLVRGGCSMPPKKSVRGESDRLARHPAQPNGQPLAPQQADGSRSAVSPENAAAGIWHVANSWRGAPGKTGPRAALRIL